MKFREYLTASTPQRNHWLTLALFLGFTKLVFYTLDSNPQVFMGDSMSYLVTAMHRWIPPDRSFVYGFVVHGLTTRARSLNSLVMIQTFAGIATSILTAAMLVRFFRVSFAVAAAIAFFVAVEPQQLLYERFVMTESLSTAIFAVFLFLAFEYVRSRKLWALIAVQFVGLLLVGFRVSFVPMLAAATVVAPILALGVRPLRPLLTHVLVSAGLFFGLHSAYKSWNGWLSNLPPAYSYADGFFLISNVSPLVSAVDTDSPELAPILAAPRVYATPDDPLNSRNSEMFADDGLVARVRQTLNDDYRSNVESRRISYRVIFRNPIGFSRLALGTYLKFYSHDYMKEILHGEAGVRELGPDEVKILSYYHLYADDLPFLKTLTRGYHLVAWPFYIVLVNTPLVMALALLLTRPPRRFMWLLFLITAIHVAAVQVLGVEPSPRHLHAATIPLALAVGVIPLLVRRGARA